MHRDPSDPQRGSVRSDRYTFDRDAVAKDRSRLRRLLDQEGVEPPPLGHQDERHVAAALEALPVAEPHLERPHDVLDHGRHVHRQLLHGAARESAAARLVAREARAVGEQDAGARAREADRRRRSRRPGPDDDRVEPLHASTIVARGPRVDGARLSVRGRRGSCDDTDPESRVRSDARGWRSRAPAGGAREATMANLAGVPERPKGAGCKPAGSAYEGSNPSPCIDRTVAQSWIGICGSRSRSAPRPLKVASLPPIALRRCRGSRGRCGGSAPSPRGRGCASCRRRRPRGRVGSRR